MEYRLKELQRRVYELKKRVKRNEEEVESMRKEWKEREERLVAKFRKDVRSMEMRMSKMEAKMGGGKRRRSGGSDSGMSVWGWRSDSDGGKDRGRKRMRSQVRKVSPSRRESERDVVETHRKKVLMVRKGRNWQAEVNFTELLLLEIGGGEETHVEVETKDKQVYKVWCEGKNARMKMLEVKKKWEEEGVAEMEERLSIAERRARARAIMGMKRMAQEAGYRNARVEVKEYEAEDGEEGKKDSDVAKE